MQVILKYTVPPSDGCQTPSEGFRLQVIHKYSVLPSEGCQTPSEGCQTPSEGFRLQVINKHLLLRDANLPLRDSILAILRF